MKKTLLTLALLLSSVVVSAQTETMIKGAIKSANEMMSITAPTDIVIQNISETNRWYFCGNKNLQTYETNNETWFVWEPTDESGSFYLKKKYPTSQQGEGYLQPGTSGANITIGAKSTAQKFKAVFAEPTDSPAGDADADNLVRFVLANDTKLWINCQGPSGTPKYNNGAGAFTMHNVYVINRNLVAELQALVDNVEAIEAGDNVGDYTSASVEALNEAIDVAKGKLNAETVVEDDIANLQKAIAGLKINLPEAGKFYTIKGSSGGYLTGKASTAYSNRGKIGLVDDYDEDYVFYYTDSKLVCYGTGLCLSHVAGGNHQAIANAFKGAAVDVTFEKSFGSATAQGAKLFVKFADGHVIKDLSNGKDRDDIGCNANTPESAQWTIAEVTTLPLAISEAGYASFYAPVAVRLPEEGLEAYAVESVSGDVAKLKAVEGVVPANTGVILKGATGNYELDITASNATVATELKGSVASAYVAGPAYVLSQPEGKEVGFYAALLNKNSEGAAATEGGTHFIANGFKAYLPVESTPANAQLFLGFCFGNSVIENLDGTETAIESIQGAKNADAVVYDLAGRRVKGAQKGLYIVNGKKVIK